MGFFVDHSDLWICFRITWARGSSFYLFYRLEDKAKLLDVILHGFMVYNSQLTSSR